MGLNVGKCFVKKKNHIYPKITNIIQGLCSGRAWNLSFGGAIYKIFGVCMKFKIVMYNTS